MRTYSPRLRGGLDMIRKEAWSFYRTIFGVRLCWELEEHKGPKGMHDTRALFFPQKYVGVESGPFSSLTFSYTRGTRVPG